MKINYIDFFSRVIPEWMTRSNQKSQEVGFGSDAYWLWAVSSIGEICKQYNDDEIQQANDDRWLQTIDQEERRKDC